MRPETIALHAGYDCDPATKAVAVPIYQTVAYSFDSAAHGAALFDLEVEGFRYTRIGNPTSAVLETRLAELEGGIDALVVSSGQSAMYYTVLNLVEPGRNLVSVPQLYGTTHTLFAHILPRFGIKVKFGRTDQPAELESLIDGNTRGLFCETVGNPAGNICDLEALAAIAQRARIPLVVDNTVPTPILMRPIEYGADIVVHSLTKFLGGHGTTLGGAVVDSGRFRWEQMGTRFPMFTEPDPSYHGLIYTKHYGDKAFIGRMRSVFQRTMGAVLSPFNAFLLLQGIETVALRVERHVENARRVAEFLRADARVDSVSYVGFPDNPYYPALPEVPRRPCLLAPHFRHPRRLRRGHTLLRRAEALQAPGEPRRCEVTRLSPRLDDPSADVARGAAPGGHRAGDHPAERRHRAHR